MDRNKIIAHASLLGVAFIYGANYTIAKEILSGEFMQPMVLVFFRILTALILFLFVHNVFIKEKVERKDLFILALSALFGVVLNQSFFITGLKYTSPINASVLMITTPILVLLLSSLFREEKLSSRKIIGVLLGAAGTLILIFAKENISFSGNLKGDLLVFFNAVSYALYLVIIKPLMKKYNPLTIVKWIFIFGFFPVFFVALPELDDINWISFTPMIWIAFVYVLVFVTFFSYLLNATALKRVSPSVVGIYIYLQPFIASIVALSLGRDELTTVKVTAGIIIIFGVYLVSFSKKKALK